jgi:hypothetical protein
MPRLLTLTTILTLIGGAALGGASLGACSCREKPAPAPREELAAPPRILPAGSVHPSHLTQPARDAGLDEPLAPLEEPTAGVVDESAAAAEPTTPTADDRVRGAPAVSANRHADADSNRDGVLDDTERAAITSARISAIVRLVDRDGDGIVTRDEAATARGHRARALEDFDAADADGDGTLSSDEVSAAVTTYRAPYRTDLDEDTEPAPSPSR